MKTSTNAPIENKKQGWLRRGGIWPLLVVLLLLGHASLMIGAATMAIGDPSFAVVPDYYDKALNYDQQKAELAASEALGWQLDISSTPSAEGGIRGRVSATLQDKWGEALTGATIHLHCTNLVGGKVQEFKLTPTTDGPYESQEVFKQIGLYKIEAVVEFADQRFLQHTELQVPGGAER